MILHASLRSVKRVMTATSTKVITSYRLVFQSDEMRGDDPTAVRSEFLEEVMRRERVKQIARFRTSTPAAPKNVF